MEDKKEKLPSTRIQWVRRNLAKTTSNPYKISTFPNRLFAYLEKGR